MFFLGTACKAGSRYISSSQFCTLSTTSAFKQLDGKALQTQSQSRSHYKPKLEQFFFEGKVFFLMKHGFISILYLNIRTVEVLE
jgi:hypothetical protein